MISSLSLGMLLLSTYAAPSWGLSDNTAFVHLFEWSWDDIAQECEEWLGPKGFSAVQISPPMEHITGSQWWTRYQPVSYNLVSRSGNKEQLVSMVKRCAAVGVSIYADAVINHMAAGSGIGLNGTGFGGRTFPLYSQEEFHHNNGDSSSNCEVNNYADQFNVQNCDLVGLPDLCTGCDSVQQKIGTYLKSLSQIGVRGFRIDAAKHQLASELGAVLRAGGAGPSDPPFVFQEVISGVGEAVKPSMYLGLGHVTEFNYANNAIGPNFLTEGKIQSLSTLGEGWGLLPSAQALIFLDNHDTQRGAAPMTYKNGALYFLANVFMLSWPYGYPKVMSSYYFDDHDQGPPSQRVHDGANLNCGDGHPWVCEHRHPAVANMVRWRAVAGSASVDNWTTISPNQVSFSRGGVAFVALNRDDGAELDATLPTGLPAGTYCNVIDSDDPSTCDQVVVDGQGKATVRVAPMTALAIHAQAPVQAKVSHVVA